MIEYLLGDTIYFNPLSKAHDITDWISEGSHDNAVIVSFPLGALRLENGVDPEQGQAANYLLWCPQKMPADICIEWDFRPIREPGLAMMWFAANGHNDIDLFDPRLAQRNGNYRQYHSSDINGYHASYFRRKNVLHERTFHTCNLRKSAGFHLVTQGADPIPGVIDILDSYHVQIIKCGDRIRFSINDLVIYDWRDDNPSTGPVHGEGYIGFRQMAPLIADYSNLRVRMVREQ